MADRKASDLIAGAVVLAVAIGFLGYAFANSGRVSTSGYTLYANFEHIDGLLDGAPVRIAGVKVGTVNSETIDPKQFLAHVGFTVANGIALPKDSSVAVTSDGLLGGKYLDIVAGGDTAMLPPGGTVTITASSISLEALLQKFIFGGVSSSKPAAGGAAPK